MAFRKEKSYSSAFLQFAYKTQTVVQSVGEIAKVSLAALKRYQDDSRMLFKNNLHETYVTFLGKTNVNQPHTHIFFTYKIVFTYNYYNLRT